MEDIYLGVVGAEEGEREESAEGAGAVILVKGKDAGGEDIKSALLEA